MLYKVTHEAAGTDSMIFVSHVIEAKTKKDALKIFNILVKRMKALKPIGYPDWRPTDIDYVHELEIITAKTKAEDIIK